MFLTKEEKQFIYANMIKILSDYYIGDTDGVMLEIADILLFEIDAYFTDLDVILAQRVALKMREDLDA